MADQGTDQVLRTIYKSLLGQCESFENAHLDAEQSIGTASAKEKLARCHTLLGEKGTRASASGELDITTKFQELTSELSLADDLEPSQMKQWREMKKVKKREIGKFRSMLSDLESKMLKHQEVRHAVGKTNDELAVSIVKTQEKATDVLGGALGDAIEAREGMEEIQEKLAANAEALNKIISDTGALDSELQLAGNRIRAIGKRIGTDRLLLGTIICCGIMVGVAIIGVFVLLIVSLAEGTGITTYLNDVTGSAPTAPPTSRRLRL